MRSVLTRTIFRRLLSNEAYIFACPHTPIRFERASLQAVRCIATTSHRYGTRPRAQFGSNGQQRRTLFGFSRKPPRQPRSTDLDPGLQTMLDLGLMEQVGARPPDRRELVEAWRKYFAYKTKKGEAVNGVQAVHVLRSFRYLRDNELSAEEQLVQDGRLSSLSLEDLVNAREVMLKMPRGEAGAGLKDHNAFAREVAREITRLKVGGLVGEEEAYISDTRYLVQALTLTGDAVEARKLLEEFWAKEMERGSTGHRLRNGLKIWNILLKGLVREGNEDALIDAAMYAEEHGVPMNAAFHETMTLFYAERNDVEKTKIWFGRELKNKSAPTTATMSGILSFCLRNDQMAWCNSIFKSLLESNPDKHVWDIVFQWAVAGLGKGVEEVEHMMEVMKRHNTNNPDVRPDIETINGLVNLAMAKNDSYLAERFLALGLRSGLYPNAKTYIMQMDYRINAGDLGGAQAAYRNLQGQEIDAEEDTPVINKYIRALCAAPSPNYDRITNIAADLDERKSRLEAKTVSALCMMYLNRDELQDVMDLLNTHTFHYTKAERASIRDEFLTFCFDRKNSVIRAWDAYTIMRQIFDETTVEMRTELMTEFFARKRSDMATHVFGHMRQHIQPRMRPVASTYVACFEGIASCSDMESLDMVHNMMKMDSSIEPTTQLYNSLMLAYTACEEPYRALDFWTDITNSREGPNYRSLEIVLWVCETKPFGDKPAKDIWARMKRMEIEVTEEVFNAYVGALAGQALLEECKAIILGAGREYSIVPDWMTLGIIYNAAPGQNRKDEIEQWARMTFPAEWEKLTKVGQREELEGHRLFNIKRNTRA